MANNFHDVGGMLTVGIDLHAALLLPGIPPAVFVPIPVPRMPHINLLHPFSMGGNQKSTVLFNGRNTVVHWHSPSKLWPHLGLPPFPIDILIPIDILFGAQVAWLPRGSVLIEGETSTCANIFGPMSINLDCWDLANIPSSLIIQPSTVQTSPSLADYAAGLQALAIDFAVSVILNKVGDAASAALGSGARRARNAVRRAFANEAGDAAQGAARREAADVAAREVADRAGREAGDAAQGAGAREAADAAQGAGAREAGDAQQQLFDDAPYTGPPAAPLPGRNPDGSIDWPNNRGFDPPGPNPGALGPGQTFDRYGGRYDGNGTFSDRGTNVSPTRPDGTAYGFEERSLPPDFVEQPFSTYRVIDPNGIPTLTGTAAPHFGMVGGAVQDTFPTHIDPISGNRVPDYTISSLLADGRIELVSRQNVNSLGEVVTDAVQPTLF